MNNQQKSPEPNLREIREVFQQEWVQLQVLGRSLTTIELQRSEVLGQVIPLLDQALAILESTGSAQSVQSN